MSSSLVEIPGVPTLSLHGRRPSLDSSETSNLNQLSFAAPDAAPLAPPLGGPPPGADDVKALARMCLDDMKAEDVVEIDLNGRTSIADAMLIATGRSQRHVGSIAEKVVQALKDGGHGRVRVEGMPSCDWVLIDAGDLIVHVFRPEVRGFYNLEKMWGVDRPSERAAAG